MAIGDQDEMLARSKAVIPRSWFPSVSPVLDGVLTGFAIVAAHVFSLIAYARAQTRIGTASDGWLDVLAYDFFALRFRRSVNELDDAYRARILAEIVRPRATRAAIIGAVQALTGRTPRFFEPANPTDTGGWSPRPSVKGYGAAWNVTGRWGSRNFPAQIFMTAFRPSGQGVPLVSGYNEPAGGYGRGRLTYVGERQIAGPVSDAQIYQVAADVKAAGTLIWMDIESTDNEFRVDSAKADQAKAF